MANVDVLPIIMLVIEIAMMHGVIGIDVAQILISMIPAQFLLIVLHIVRLIVVDIIMVGIIELL